MLARRARPERPELRQVRLLNEEVLAHPNRARLAVGPGALSENVAALGIKTQALPGTGLHLRMQAEIEVP